MGAAAGDSDRRVAGARAAVVRGAYGEAVGLLEVVLADLEATAGPGSLQVARVLNELGVACKFAGRLDEAEAYYTRAVRLIEKHEGSACDDMATLLHNLGGLAHSRQRYTEGLGPARQGLALRQRLHGPDDVAVAADAAALAALLEGVGDNAEAERLYRRALAVFDAAGETSEAAMVRNGLGSACQALERFDEAETHYLRALAQLEGQLGTDHPQLGHILNNLATLHRRRGEDTQARQLLSRAHDLLVRTLGPSHPVTIEVAANKRRVDATPSPYV